VVDYFHTGVLHVISNWKDREMEVDGSGIFYLFLGC